MADKEKPKGQNKMINIFLASIMGTILHLKRRCLKCRREQVVKPSEMHKTVKCEFCGASMPPSRTKGYL
jgi:ribosomal protein S27E